MSLFKYKTFEIKPEHLKLLKEMYVSWDDCEFGAPCIDPKRPYGNCDVYEDMIKILGLKEIKEGIFEFTLFEKTWILKGEDKNNLYLDGKDERKLLNELKKLHDEMDKVLQICLSTQTFEIGTYKAEEYSNNWFNIKKWV